MPSWRAADGQRVPTHACAACGRPAPLMRYPLGTLRLLGWTIGTPTSVVNWCGHATVYVPRATARAWVQLVPTRDNEEDPRTL